MDATATVAIITAIGAVVISVTTLILAHLRDTKNMLTLGRVEDVTAKTHTLVNSQSLATERLLLVALKRIAVDDPTADNINAAEAMEKQVEEHEERQAKVDAVLKK